MRQRVLRVAGLCLALAGLWLAVSYTLTRYGIGIPCVFYKMTGLYCPGCGGGRALAALGRLEFRQAARYNPLLLAALPFLLYWGGKSAYHYIRHGQFAASGRFELPFSIAFAVVAVLFGIARNLPAFAVLAPAVLP